MTGDLTSKPFTIYARLKSPTLRYEKMSPFGEACSKFFLFTRGLPLPGGALLGFGPFFHGERLPLLSARRNRSSGGT